jgi:hypothetical protein
MNNPTRLFHAVQRESKSGTAQVVLGLSISRGGWFVKTYVHYYNLIPPPPFQLASV